MSDPVFTNTDRAPSMSTGGHDTGLYDPDRHDNRIVAVFETRERAVAARDLLIKAGVPSGDMELLDQSQVAGTTPAGDITDQGIWGSIKSLFVPDEDAYGYAEGVRRGHAVLSVNPAGATDRHRVIEVLESTDPIDFDARLEEWRQAGYAYPNSSAVGAAEGMITPAPARLPDDDIRGVETGAAITNSDLAPEAAAGPAGSAPGASAMGQPGVPDATSAADEQARTGKREVAQGAVRVRSYVMDRPIDAATAPTGGKTTTATTGATSSGVNAPRS